MRDDRAGVDVVRGDDPGDRPGETPRLADWLGGELGRTASGPWLCRLNAAGEEPSWPLLARLSAPGVVALAPAGDGWIAAASAEGTLRAWDVREPGAPPRVLPGPPSQARALAWVGEPLPEMTMFGLSRIPSRSTRWW